MSMDPMYTDCLRELEQVKAERDELARDLEAERHHRRAVQESEQRLTAQLTEARADERQAMHYLESVRQAAGHDGDFPSLIEAVAALKAARREEVIDAVRRARREWVAQASPAIKAAWQAEAVYTATVILDSTEASEYLVRLRAQAEEA